MTDQLDHLASAQSQEAQQNLTKLMQSGLLLTNQHKDSTAQLTSQALALLYGNVIPAAWAISSAKPNPFILYAPHHLGVTRLTLCRRVDAKDWTCNTPIPSSLKDLATLFDGDTASQTVWCDPE